MKKENFLKVLILVGILGISGCDNNTNSGTVSNATNTSGSTAGTQVGDLRVYEATGDYDTPAGSETVNVKVSLEMNRYTINPTTLYNQILEHQKDHQ